MTDETDTTGPAAFRGLLATATQLGRYAWLERRLFEVLGAWSVTETDPAVKLLLDAQSHEHAWHAQLLFERLPELREVDPEALVVAPSAAYAAAVEQVGTAGPLVARLVGAHQVLVPQLLVAYRRELAAADPFAGASLRRWLGFAVADLTEEWAAGQELLASLLVDAEQLELAATTEARLRRALLASGGLSV
jgi:hypothetical protein